MRLHPFRQRRFTPTRVGNTWALKSSHRTRTVHPHACGEYCHYGYRWKRNRGSPPRVWGILILTVTLNRQMRFTPTRVGNTQCLCTAIACSAVHPHACGEYSTVVGLKILILGSPPRVWGIRVYHVRRSDKRRFTPTRVGNTGHSYCSVSPASVHPHACGEYAARPALVVSIYGSPPRVWGIRVAVCACVLPPRFTPTRVGNTRSSMRVCATTPVHPHACGEYSKRTGAIRRRYGSPPRVWGIPRREINGDLTSRFTPTRVGNTEYQAEDDEGNTVHPHACGEYVKLAQATGVHIGSPPRVWGILSLDLMARVTARFTPTRVGNTLYRS